MPVRVLADLRRRLDALARKTSPLVLSRVHWVEPKLVAEITYLTWTADGLLRHTVYAGLREDKPAADVRREAAGARWRFIGSMGTFLWAATVPIGVASGRTGVRVIAVVQLRARNSLHRPKRAFRGAKLRVGKCGGRRRVRNACNGNGVRAVDRPREGSASHARRRTVGRLYEVASGLTDEPAFRCSSVRIERVERAPVVLGESGDARTCLSIFAPLLHAVADDIQLFA
jgi:hypothetical protein